MDDIKWNSQMEYVTKSYEKPLKLDNIQHIKYRTSPHTIFIDMWELELLLEKKQRNP